MATFNLHAGHAPYNSGGAYGAVGILNESDEARIVKNELKKILEERGHTVYDCTCEKGLSQNKVLNSIVQKCNSHKVDLDISIHLNSGRNDYNGDGNTGGCEVYGYNDEFANAGKAISNAIATGLGIRDRGFKINTDLYVLRKTSNPAILIECCFVDDKDDAEHWNAQKCAVQIADALRNTVAADVKVNVEPVKIQNGINNTPQWVGKIIADKLNVRTGAGVEFPNLEAYPKLSKNNLVDVCDDRKDKNGEKWFYIKIAGKHYGYVMAKYVVKN